MCTRMVVTEILQDHSYYVDSRVSGFEVSGGGSVAGGEQWSGARDEPMGETQISHAPASQPPTNYRASVAICKPVANLFVTKIHICI